jgi:spore maturation protein CgeB
MKTLLVYSELSGFAIQIKNHIYDALEELSVEVRECYIEDVKEMSESFAPTMHIFLHHSHKLYDHLETIKNLKGHKLLWTMEDPWESDVTFDMLPYFYYIFTTDGNTALKLIEEAPNNKIFYVPHACDPKIHKPMDVPWNYKSDVCFVGNAYKSRIAYLEKNAAQWKNLLVTVVGVGYRGMDGYQHQHVIHGHIDEPEIVQYYNGAKTVLNLHRLSGDLDMANKRNIQPRHLNNRFYEIAACGKQQVVEGRDNMKQEIEKISTLSPEEYSYKARLKEYYLPLLK